MRRIKEKVAIVAASTSALGSLEEITYKLPDGMPVKISGRTRGLIAEYMFSGKQYVEGMQMYAADSLQDLVMQVVKSVDAQHQAALLKSIIVSGGTTKTPGFVDRLCKELQKMSNMKVECTRGKYDQTEVAALVGAVKHWVEDP